MNDLLALHGIACRIPGEWDVAINRGGRKGGYVVVVHRRNPLLNITWDRRPRSPDPDKSIGRIAKRLRTKSEAVLEGTEALRRGQLARFKSPEGIFHLAIFRPRDDEAVTVILRQLSPGTADELRALVADTRVYAADEVTPWRIHGIAVDLPPAWFMQGVQQYTGLARAVWFRGTGKAHRHDQALVLRRFACAERMLDGQDLTTWIGSRLAKRERLESYRTDPGPVWRGHCTAPGDNWLKRLRRVRDDRILHAWIEADRDRLLIQEWKGSGDPLPPMTVHHPPERSPLVEVAA